MVSKTMRCSGSSRGRPRMFEKTCTGDMFYWPPFHTIRAEKDTEFVLFSPQHEHGAVMDHVKKKLGG